MWELWHQNNRTVLFLHIQKEIRQEISAGDIENFIKEDETVAIERNKKKNTESESERINNIVDCSALLF